MSACLIIKNYPTKALKRFFLKISIHFRISFFEMELSQTKREMMAPERISFSPFL